MDLNAIDHAATLWLNGINCPASDAFWKFASTSINWIWFYLLLAALLFWKLGWKKTLLTLVAIGLTIAATDQMANLFKNGFCRLRPCWDDQMVSDGLNILVDKGGSFGFFSAHASTTFGIASCASLCFLGEVKDRKFAWMPYVMFFWCTLVALSRVFVGKHFLGDIIVGAAFGILFGCILAVCARLIFKKI